MLLVQGVSLFLVFKCHRPNINCSVHVNNQLTLKFVFNWIKSNTWIYFILYYNLEDNSS